jgi:acetolactate synthase-1/3 small subunit
MSETEGQKSLVSILADNKKGMLAKITAFFAENDMNIESLTLSPADIENKVHRTTAYISGDRSKIDALCKEMEKIDGVQKVINFMTNSFIERELGLVKVKVKDASISKITDLVNQHLGETIFINSKIMICQIKETEEKVSKFMIEIKKLTDDVEILRTGIVATSLDEGLN